MTPLSRAPQPPGSGLAPTKASAPRHAIRQQQGQHRARARMQCRAQFESERKSIVNTQNKKRAALFEYVDNAEPTLIDKFSEQAPATVVDAMRTTVRGSLGTLPPQFFNVQISSRLDSFAQLLYSHMMAGYMFRNALYRMELRGALILPAALPSADGSGGSEAAQLVTETDEQLEGLWAPGTQTTRVSGDVLRWHLEHGPQAIPARQYISDLEAEIRSLKQQVASVRMGSANNNELLDYVQSLGTDAELLTSNASQDVLDAMTAFIDRCMGSNEHTDLASITEYNVNELAPQLMWTAIIGYMLRSLEVQHDIQSSIDEFDSSSVL